MNWDDIDPIAEVLPKSDFGDKGRKVAETRQGNFREELYYRVNVVRVELPPFSVRSQVAAVR